MALPSLRRRARLDRGRLRIVRPGAAPRADEPLLVDPLYPGQVPAPDVEVVGLSVDGWADLLTDFNATVTDLSLANVGRPGWWFTWLSARDRHHADLLDTARLVASIEAMLPTADGRRGLRVEARTLATAEALAAAAERAGWTAVVALTDRLAWRLSAASDHVREVVWVGRFAVSSWVRIVGARSRRPAVVADVVVVTVLGTGAVVAGRYRDGYFGELADALAAGGERVVVFGQLGDRPEAELVARLGDVDEPQIVTVWQAVGHGEAFRAAWRALRTRVRTDLAAYPAPITEGLVRQALRGDAVMRAEAFLLLAGIEALLAAAPTSRVIHMYEGNPWERAADMAARAATPPRHAIGYLHAPVLPAHQKYRLDPAELGLRPLPDRFVCTGPAAAARLRAIGDWTGMDVVPGCALRLPELGARSPRSRPPAQVRRVLVVLDALVTSAALVAVADAVAVLLGPGTEVAVRSHPALPISALAPASGVDLDRSPIVSSDGRSLAEDLDASDVVLYRGSSVALLAAYWGIPVVHLDGRDRPSDDPLDGWDLLKDSARTPADVVDALRRAPTASAEDHERAVAATRAYVEQLLAPVDDDGIAAFRPPVASRVE